MRHVSGSRCAALAEEDAQATKLGDSSQAAHNTFRGGVNSGCLLFFLSE